MHAKLSLAALLAASLAASTFAQEAALIERSNRDLRSGLGRPTFGPIALESIVAQGSNLGCAYLNGEIFVSSRGTSTSTSAPHTCHVFNRTGNLLRSFTQTNTLVSVWGWRDGASDGVGTLIWGYEATIEFTDAQGNPAASIRTQNGQRALTSNLLRPGAAGISTYRAIAYNPAGNSGNGSLYVGDFGSPIVELDLSGVEIGRIAHNGSWSLYGLAWHPATGKLWGNSSPNGETGRIVEIDPVTGQETGLGFSHASGIQGGLDIVAGGLDGRNAGYDLLSVVQGAPDVLQGHRLDLYDTLRAGSEVQLLHGIDGAGIQAGGAGPLDDSAVRIATLANSTWELDLDDRNPTPRAFDAAAYFVNLAPFALPDGQLAPGVGALFPSLIETRFLDGFTTPFGATLSIPTAESAGPLSLSIPAILNIQGHRTFVRVQAVYADLNVPSSLPVMLTNQVRLGLDETVDVVFPPAPAVGVTARAIGANSFNADASSGFFQIDNTGALHVLQVEVALPPGFVWDVDEINMAGSFINGNGTAVGCTGTYRNNSQTTTGLDFVGTDGTGCDPAARRGFYLDPSATVLTFSFARPTGPNGGFGPGERFEWDCDTEGGGSVIPGDAHAGTVVTVRVQDAGGNVFASTGTMIVTGTPQEAAVSF